MNNAATDELMRQIEQREAELKVMKDALALLTGGTVALGTSRTTPTDRSFEGIGIVDATKRYLKEVGEARTTSEIKDALMNRGWTTRSKNATATIYATLDNSKQFVRTGDGRWSIKGEKGSR